MGMTLKIDENDLLVPWLVSKHTVLQFSYPQVFLPQHDKVWTSGESLWQQRKTFQHLTAKTMTCKESKDNEIINQMMAKSLPN